MADQDISDNSQTNTNLIINYLPQSLTDKEFYHLFSLVGPVTSARVIRDKNSGYSFGYGFVDYENPKDAAKAITQLDKHPIQHKTIKVAFSKPSGLQTKNINLYIAGLPADVTDEQLRDHFKKAGEIVQCNVIRDKNTGMCQGIGFVLYSSKDEADGAIQEFNGGTFSEMSTKPLIVRYARNEQRNPYQQAFARSHQLQKLQTAVHYPSMWYNAPAGFGGNNSVGGGGGPIRGTKAGRGRYSPMSYNNSNSFNNGNVQGFTPNTNGTIVFVYGIGPNTTEEMLRELFDSCGNISAVNVIYDHAKGAGKGYGFVTFDSKQEANYAVHCLNKCAFQGRTLQVSIKT